MDSSNRTPDDRQPEPPTVPLLPARPSLSDPCPEHGALSAVEPLNPVHPINNPAAGVKQMAREATELVQQVSVGLEPGDLLGPGGRFQIVRMVYNAPGKTVVYDAKDRTHDDRRIAVKVVFASGAALPLTDLKREAERTANLDAEYAPVVYDHGIDQPRGFAWMAMEYLEGGTLREWMAKEKRLSWEQARKVCKDVLEGLRNGYARGLAHRDLKPSNVMRSRKGSTWKIVDWGLACNLPAGTGVALDRAASGTATYMAPECWEMLSRCSRQSDFYALGIMLVEMLTGRHPFHALSLPEIWEAQKAPDYLAQIANVPEQARPLVARATANNPADRYGDVDEFLADLDSQTTPRPRKRRTGLWLALACAAALILAAAAFFHPWRGAPVHYKGKFDLWLIERDGIPCEPRAVGGPKTLPLRVRDGIVLDGRLEQGAPAHFYVIWIDSAGKSTRVHPDKWSDKQLPPEDEKQQELHWPKSGERGQLLSESPGGLESVLWLVRDKPLDQGDNSELQKMLDALSWRQRPEWRSKEIVVWWEDGLRVVPRGAPERRAEAAEDDPVYQTEKLLLALKERGLARYSRAVCYSFAGR